MSFQILNVMNLALIYLLLIWILFSLIFILSAILVKVGHFDLVLIFLVKIFSGKKFYLFFLLVQIQ